MELAPAARTIEAGTADMPAAQGAGATLGPRVNTLDRVSGAACQSRSSTAYTPAGRVARSLYKEVRR